MWTMWSWNEFEYYVIERRLGPGLRGLRRWLTAGLARVRDGRARPAQAPREERPRMPAVETMPLVPSALGKLLLSRLDAESAQAIRAAVTEELLELVKAEAVTVARAELEEAFATRRELLLDQLDRQRRQIERDADARAELEAQATLAEEAADWQERLDEVRTERRDALIRAQEAEAALTGMLTEMVGGVDGRPVYLYSGGEGLRSLDKAAVNRILARAGVVLKSKATASERRVRLTLDDGRPVEHSLFWLTKAPAAGVDDEDAEAEDLEAHKSA